MASNNSASSANSTTQPISLIGTMGLVQNPQIQNMNLLASQRAQQIAAFSGQARASPQQLVTGVRPIVNVVGNQPTVATLQNVQVLGNYEFLCYYYWYLLTGTCVCIYNKELTFTKCMQL